MKDVALVVLTALVLLLWLRPPPTPPPPPEAPARTEALIRDLAERGWIVTRAEAVGDLTRALREERDSASILRLALAELAERARLLGGEVRASAELLAAARTELRLRPVVERTPTSWSATATWDDGTFFGRLVYRDSVGAAPDLHFPELGARIRAALVATAAPDGTLLLSAYPTDPRTTLTLDRVRVDLPGPVQYCDWRTRARWGIGGLAIGAVAGLLR